MKSKIEMNQEFTTAYCNAHPNAKEEYARISTERNAVGIFGKKAAVEPIEQSAVAYMRYTTSAMIRARRAAVRARRRAAHMVRQHSLRD